MASIALSIDITQQEDDGENARDTDSQPMTTVLGVGPENNPAEHDQKDPWKVQLNHIVSHMPLQREGHFEGCVIACVDNWNKVLKAIWVNF